MEIKPIFNFEQYFISMSGVVCNSRGLILKDRISKFGYNRVALCVSGKYYHRHIHRLVWESWVGPIRKGLFINHLDGNKLNNNINNLELVTPKQNTHHAIKLGLFKPKHEDNPNSKLNITQVREIRLMYTKKRGILKHLSNQFGVSSAQILHIINGKSWGDAC